MFRPKSMVLWKAVVLTAFCAVAIFGLWWWGLVHSPEGQARAHAQESLVQMERTIARELSRAEGTGLAFGAWWTREQGRLDDPARLQNVISFLEKGDIVTNLILSRENGDSACVVRRDGAWNLVLFRGGKNPRRYLVERGRWVRGQVDERDVYDAKVRHWYRFGAAQSMPAWTPEAYRYYTSAVGGFTYTVPIRNTQGVLEGVIGVDVSLEELTQSLWMQQPTPGTRLMVTDPGGRLLVPPRTPGMLDLGTRFAHHLMELPPVYLEKLARGKVKGLSDPNAFLESRTAYITAVGAYAAAGMPRMHLRIAIPEAELFPGLKLRRILAFLLALGAILGVAWSLLDLQWRMVRPMRKLAEEAEAPGPEDADRKDFESDIWELQRVGQKLCLANRAAQERDRLLDRAEHSQRVDSVGILAPGIVHDVNNQLALVLGQITFCQTVLEGHPELQPRLQAAEGATLKCAEVLRALLDYSRPDQGRRELLSLNDAVEGAAGLLRRVLGHSIRVEEELDRHLPMLFGEPVKLQQVLVNLGLNARDAMPEGGVLAFRTFRSGDNACLEVRDTGSGMSEDVKRRAFEPFFSTKGVGKGTGLGLAMVANIVAAHGGQIQVESAPGSGTRFCIEFPPSLRKQERVGLEGQTLEPLNAKA